jgi:hypothetical protein
MDKQVTWECWNAKNERYAVWRARMTDLWVLYADSLAQDPVDLRTWNWEMRREVPGGRCERATCGSGLPSLAAAQAAAEAAWKSRA